MHFAELLKSFRRRKGWTQWELAVRVNFSPATISKWESGRSIPRSESILALAQALELNTTERAALLDGIDSTRNLIQETSVKHSREDNTGEVPTRLDAARNKHSTTLNLSDQNLITLPDSISQLTNLKSLDLSSNRLTKLPDFIGELTNLEDLALSRNQLSSLPESFSHLKRLKILDISNNLLTRLPESITKLSNLENLNLSGNKLSSIPESIDHLTSLRELNLLVNELVTMPDSIGRLSQLITIDLSHNRLSMLPDSIGNLKRLTSIDLSHNLLNSLPDSLSNLRSLKALYLHYNKALGLPTEVLGSTWDEVEGYSNARPAVPSEILLYYSKLQSGRRPLNEAKLILVGRGAVGKTSIVNRLVHNSFKDEKKTEGIQITEWNIHLKGENVRLNIWDFGGQEIMHATHQFFLTQRSLYLLVLNGREGGEDADADYWLKIIESFASDSPVIVVLNKTKEHPFDVNRRALQQKYPSIRDFIKTDCADESGLKELRKAIELETDRLEHLRDAFPASWFSIKNKLAGIKRNYLSFDEYRDICSKLGETDQEAQDGLASYLHSLGIALNYKDDPRLLDTHVLNPHWVTYGIYKIINAERLEAQNGEIRLNDLHKILDEKNYPPRMHRFLFDLMRKFDLCFSFPGNDTHYLIPELLGKQEPREATQFSQEKCLNFQYHYPILPEGLLPRFIVRTHILSEGLARWRTGVILKFETNKALVKADVQDKKVTISVSGLPAGRRRLLAIIRSDFERIHRDIRNLQPQGMVPLPDFPETLIPYQELLVMEESKIKLLPKVVGNRIIQVDINTLLNGVDLDGTRGEYVTSNTRSGAAQLFYSYSHKDESLRDELEAHLKLLQRQGVIHVWHDRKIEAGDDWRNALDEHLEQADLILLLISADFMNSDYCYENEMKRAMERHSKGETVVVPIIIRDVNWARAPFAKLQALPKDGVAVTRWTDRDSAWRSVSEGIENIVSNIQRATK
jgi:internalin A